jgi:MobA/MobL family
MATFEEGQSILADMSQAAARTRKGARAKGRYARTTDFGAPAQRSTRPDMGGGTTFHFAHKALSRRNDVSDGLGTMTSASAHQGYIERKEAGAMVDEESASVLKEAAEQKNANLFLNTPDTTDLANTAQPEGGRFQRAPFVWTKDRAGFGTLGATPIERKSFWQTVERSERRHGRVQSRVIAELPHEASAKERTEIALAFCKKLEDEGLPYWASIHAPTGKNDKRNHHLHIAYYERPAQRDANGVWDFEVTRQRKKSNRTTVTERPFQQNKSASVRARGWVKTLRSHFAESSNMVLEKGGHSKRLDPRSYKDAGLAKEPTKHLGFKAHAMEAYGLDTQVGSMNAEREVRWRVHDRTRRWERAIAVEDVAGLFTMDDGMEDWSGMADRRSKLEEGRATAKLGAETDLFAERLTLRLDKRLSFLDKEGARLLNKGRGLRIADTAQDILTIESEKIALETREEEARALARALEEQARGLRKKEATIWNSVFGTSDAQPIFAQDILADDLWDIPGRDTLKADATVVASTAARPPKEQVKETREPEDATDRTVEQPTGTESQPATATPTDTSPPAQRPAAQAFQKGLGNGNDDGLLLVGRLERPEDIRALDTALRAMTNKETRLRAIATRDMVDLLDEGTTRDEANRGWVVLRAEAQRRGLNLETGRLDPKKATDKERAALHRDEYLSSVLEVRQEVVTIRTR